MNTQRKEMVKLTLVRSLSKCLKAHVACVRGLGLRRIGSSVEVGMTPEIKGMVDRVSYLLKVERV